mmetsp:Transcript_21509/g.48445  ORF Transcript_21509/g.48445 Transcript_21509/m.48445 type:complete len:142 (-) Transcript_21509:462-887(-)
MFVAEGDLVICSGADREDAKVFSAFRTQYGTAIALDAPIELPGDAKLLFKVTVEDPTVNKNKKQPVIFVGVAHGSPFSETLAYFDATYGAPPSADNKGGGAFLLEGGFGVNPGLNAGQVFMKYGHQLSYHTKVDHSRVAYR